MNNNTSKGISYTSGFFLLIGLAIVISLVVGIIVLSTLGASAITDPGKAGTLRLVQVISVLTGMFAPAVLTAYLLNRQPFRLLGYGNRVPPVQIALVIGIVVLSLFAASAFGFFNRQIPVSGEWKRHFDNLEKAYNDQVAIMLNFKTTASYILSLVILAFVPALCEETLFRGGLQNFMTRATHRPWLSIVVVAALFSLAHFSFYLFLPRFFLGLMLGAIYYLSRNIWLSITAHFINNALAVTQVYILMKQGKSLATAMNSDLPITYWGILVLPLLVYLLVLLRKSTPAATVQQSNSYGI